MRLICDECAAQVGAPAAKHNLLRDAAAQSIDVNAAEAVPQDGCAARRARARGQRGRDPRGAVTR
eukprot:4549985-Prymnesium_polylepis.1